MADRPTPAPTARPKIPGFVGMLHSGQSDLSERAKDIVRGYFSPEDWRERIETARRARELGEKLRAGKPVVLPRYGRRWPDAR